MPELVARNPLSMGTEPFSIELPDECDAEWATAFQEDFLNRAPLPCDIQLNAASVSRMTTVAVQLLLALSKTITAENFHLGIEASSPAFRSAFTDLGLGETLSHWGVK